MAGHTYPKPKPGVTSQVSSTTASATDSRTYIKSTDKGFNNHHRTPGVNTQRLNEGVRTVPKSKAALKFMAPDIATLEPIVNITNDKVYSSLADKSNATDDLQIFDIQSSTPVLEQFLNAKPLFKEENSCESTTNNFVGAITSSLNGAKLCYKEENSRVSASNQNNDISKLKRIKLGTPEANRNLNGIKERNSANSCTGNIEVYEVGTNIKTSRGVISHTSELNNDF